MTRDSRGAYAELHCHSNFSFLDGASTPEDLAIEAARLELDALALTDHDGFYGIVRFAKAARALNLKTIFGSELTIGVDKPQNGIADPTGKHLVVLARNPNGYASLSRSISHAQLQGEKGAPRHSLEYLSAQHNNDWLILTGCRKGIVPHALVEHGPAAAEVELRKLIALFGQSNVAVELWDHGNPLDSARNDALAQLGIKCGVDLVATNNVHYATARDHALANAIAAVRSRRSLDEMGPWLPLTPVACLRSADEQAQWMARYPGVVERAGELGLECAFDLNLVAPKLPDCPTPDGYNEMTWLRELTRRGALDRYGHHDDPANQRAYEQIEYELTIIEQLGFPGYFLIVWDIVQFCKRSNIFCQGRGSAANSAVCYALGITNADAVKLELLFERFLSPERDGPPDIDVDIESDRREEVIQYIFNKYGREKAAQVANVITYRPKSAVQDMAKALGFSPGQSDAWSKQTDGWGAINITDSASGADADTETPANVLQLAAAVQDFPRHLGIHCGGMVICDKPIVEVCPIERARMENRTVVQWDKEDCAAAGLVKFDLLGLGMLSALHYCVDIIKDSYGIDVDLAKIPQEDEVYEALCQADSMGVFQVESRAQMGTLPRLKPRVFYDLVIEVALIRPGPIQGGSVHPYLRRRDGTEPVTYLHPLLEKSLKKTLGVPLFQEQLMQMAIDLANFTPAEADELRMAMGSKRSAQRIEALKQRLFNGMDANGIHDQAIKEEIFKKLLAFSKFGFPESHSVSFAYIVYSSAWCRFHYPAAFLASLLRAQPMGFWSPQSLVADAKRHGVEVLRPSINESDAVAKVVYDQTVRLGIDYVRGIGAELAQEIAANQPYTDIKDLARKVKLSSRQLEALAAAGAFDCLGISRRDGLWAAGVAEQARPERIGIVVGDRAPQLPMMNEFEIAEADMWSTGITPDSFPTEFVRDELDALGVVTSAGLVDYHHGDRVTVGGVVTHRQRPETAIGITFVNLEDETGLINVICSKGLWARYRKVVQNAPALLVRGRLEKVDGATNLVAERVQSLPISLKTKSRDFH